ncbi:hypothetical protein V8C40DRAFT_285722 [Trichoderma camerunense]
MLVATISNVVFHVKYTSVDSSAALRNAANASVKQYLKEVKAATEDSVTKGSYALLEVRNDFANEWRQSLISKSGKIMLGGIIDRLPFWTRGQNVTICRVAVIVRKEPGSWADKVSLSTGSGSVDLEAAADINLGDKTTVLLNKNPVSESASSSWELALDAEVFNQDFFRTSDIYIVVKFITEFLGLKK